MKTIHAIVLSMLGFQCCLLVYCGDFASLSGFFLAALLYWFRIKDDQQWDRLMALVQKGNDDLIEWAKTKPRMEGDEWKDCE